MQSAPAQQVALFEDAPDRSEPRSIFFFERRMFLPCRALAPRRVQRKPHGSKRLRHTQINCGIRSNQESTKVRHPVPKWCCSRQAGTRVREAQLARPKGKSRTDEFAPS